MPAAQRGRRPVHCVSTVAHPRWHPFASLTESNMTRVVALLMACVALASCSRTMESVSEKVIDWTPAWMGGLPKDAPPRPGTPEYDEFRRKQEAELARDKSHDSKPEHCNNEKATSVIQHPIDRACSTDDHVDPSKGH